MKILFLLLLFFHKLLFCQQYKIVNYNVENSLETNDVVDVATVESICYIATHNKIYKFDGLNFLEFKFNKLSLSDDYIKKISVYNKKSLFVLFKKGCIEINLSNRKSKVISNDSFFDIYSDYKNMIFLKSNFLIETYHTNGSKIILKNFQRYLNPNIPPDFNAKICLFKNKLFISVPHQGIFWFDQNKYYKVTDRNNCPGGYKEFFKIQNDSLFFLGLKDPYFFNERKKRFLKYKLTTGTKYTNGRINDIYYENNNYWFIQNDKDLFVKNNNNIKEFSITEDENIELRKIFINSDRICLSSNKGFYVIYKNRSFIRHLTNEYRSYKHARTRRKIIENKNQIILFGNPQPVSVVNNKIYNHKSLPALSIYDAVIGSNGYYVGTEGQGLYFLNFSLNKSVKINIPDIIPNNETISALYYDRKEKKIYAGDSNFLYFFNETKNYSPIELHKVPFEGGQIKIITKDTIRNIFYIGASKGLYIFTKHKFIKIKDSEVTDLYIDYKKNNLWIGHQKGIDILSIYSKVHTKFLKIPFVNPTVASITRDDNNFFWVSTFSGIVCYDAFGNLKIKLTKKNGLINNEYNFKSSIKLKNGKIIFGGVDGYDIIDPINIEKSNKWKNYGYISDISLMGKDTVFVNNFSKKDKYILKFNRDKYFARIYLSLKRLDNLGSYEFRYRINKGVWLDLNKSYLDLIAYESGEYTIEFESIDNTGRLIHFKPIIVDVQNSFFKTKAFLFLIFATIIILITVLFKIKLNTNNKINGIYNEISMDLHDELGALISKTALITKSSNSFDMDIKDKIISNLDIISHNLKIYINSPKQKKISIINLYESVNDIFGEYFFLRELLFLSSSNLEKNCYVPNNLVKDLKLCCLEIANNIAKHSTATEVELTFFQFKKIIRIVIIFNEYYNVSNFNNRLGNGLNNIETRTAKYNGSFEISQYNYKTKFKLEFFL
ncbi:hypothetical protein [Chryseobacterium sp. HMWF035]|uniref:hypothetical protein n=1 Tax=Chryseobacterium sp. HMWF035 TaxID=2056868 RepID=UPI000D571CFB|nr:hypothetical protein [Chryseobacterium sp. HMWF035]PVV55076.1 hypothetical protein DD829_16220 [Chryseobacterium sp. HMWF035]